MTEMAGQVTCVRASIFGDGLTAGGVYALLAYDAERDRVRVSNDRGRARWYPADCFARSGATSPQLASFTLDDAIADPAHDCIEVTVQLADGRRRWCFFATARWLLSAVSGTVEPKRIEKDGLHLTQLTYLGGSLTTRDGATFGMVSVPHMIVVSELSEAIVAEALGHLAGQGDLECCTRPLDGGEDASGAEGRSAGRTAT